MATQKSTGRWQACRTVNGKRYYGYGSTPLDAEEDAARKAGIIGSLRPSYSLAWFIETYWVPGTKHLNQLTRHKYRAIVSNHILPHLGAHDMRRLDSLTVRNWLDILTCSKSSKQTARNLLRQILEMAYEYELIDRNPVNRVKVKTPKSQPRERILSTEDAQELLVASLESHLSAPIYLAAILGLRRGEAIGLKWSNISADGLIKVSEQRQRNLEGGEQVITTAPKRGKQRAFYVPKQIIEEIHRRGNQDHAYVCTNPKGKPWRPDSLSRDWTEFRDNYRPDLGYPLKDWSFHDLRHLAVGLLRRAGADITTISTICGHTNIAMTLSYMAMLSSETKDVFGSVLSTLDQSNMPESMPSDTK